VDAQFGLRGLLALLGEQGRVYMLCVCVCMCVYVTVYVGVYIRVVYLCCKDIVYAQRRWTALLVLLSGEGCE